MSNGEQFLDDVLRYELRRIESMPGYNLLSWQEIKVLKYDMLNRLKILERFLRAMGSL